MSVITIIALLLSGLLMIFSLGKQQKAAYPAGAFLLVMGGWKLADYILNGALAASWAIWPYRAVLLVVLLAAIYFLLKDRGFLKKK